VTLDLAYVRRSVDAAFSLAMRDERAWSRFDLTTEGFYRSFAAIFLVIPINILIDYLGARLSEDRRLERQEPVIPQTYEFADALFSTATLVTQWLIFPLAMIVVLRFLGLTHRYSALVIAHNWGTVVVALVNLPAFLLYAAGLISVDQAIDLNFIVLGLTLYYRYYIAQTALDAGWPTAASITLLEFLLQLHFAIAVSLTAHLWLPAAS